MCPCSPNDISFDLKPSLGAPSIPGFGSPFATKLPGINEIPFGFPEDLLDLFNKVQLLIPPGSLKPQLTFETGKSVFDAIMKLMDEFLPFLMLYKFFLPILNIIVCIIEVICAFANPTKLIKTIKRLFTQCIPDFLNLFPIFALIIMIISLLLLLISLIEFILAELARLVELILTNVKVLYEAININAETAILAVISKIGALLCSFQNLFVLFALFSIIVQVFKDIINLSFGIPPCDDDNASDFGCCTSEVCPDIVKSEYTKFSGTLKYLNKVIQSNPIPGMGALSLESVIREETWQLFDNNQSIKEQFINIVNAYDVKEDKINYPKPPHKPIYFPTDTNITNETALEQVPYLIDLKFWYNPINFGRVGIPRFVIFKNCVVIKQPTTNLYKYDNSTVSEPTGVVKIVGGLGYEQDETTILKGYADDNITETTQQATLETFIKLPVYKSSSPILSSTDGAEFLNIEYTFKPNIKPLQNKGIVTAGCAPELSFAKNFINQTLGGDIALKTLDLKNLKLPDIAAAQECLTNSISLLRSGLNEEAVGVFQASCTACLESLKKDTLDALNAAIGIGVDPCKSSFTATPTVQFTSKTIKVKIELKERNGISMSANLPETVATDLATKIKLHTSFGETTKITYDGSKYFTSEIKSKEAGKGKLMVSFDNNIFCTISTDTLTQTLQNIDYEFVYSAANILAEGDASDGSSPRRDESDQSIQGRNQ